MKKQLTLFEPQRTAVPPGSMIAVWFSCGAASAVAAKKTLERYGDSCQVRIVNNPIAEEHPDNLRFLRDVEKWLNVDIEYARNPKYPQNSAVKVWQDRKAMSFPKGAPCTQELKRKARQRWEADNNMGLQDYLVMGFTSDEKGRSVNFQLTERPNLIPVLIEESLTKFDCWDILIDSGIKPPQIYSEGFPNANCIGCCKATSPTYWNLVRQKFPDVFDQRAKQSRQLGSKLVRVNGLRIFLDELSPDAIGDPISAMPTIDCGIFCEEET